MKIIHMYEIPIHGVVTVPISSTVLKIHEQHGQICMWVEFDETYRESKTKFYKIIPTDVPFEDEERSKYLDTIFMENGLLVFHIYEISKPLYKGYEEK